jgi:hypothetical protein
MIARNPNLSSPGATGISNPHQRTQKAITEQRSKYITEAIPMTAITDCLDRILATNGGKVGTDCAIPILSELAARWRCNSSPRRATSTRP